MNMFFHHSQNTYDNIVSFCSLCYTFFAKFFILVLPKHVISILRTPFEMLNIKPHFVRCMLMYHFCSSPTSKAHATFDGRCVARFSLATHFFISRIEKLFAIHSRTKVRRFLAQKILKNVKNHNHSTTFPLDNRSQHL